MKNLLLFAAMAVLPLAGAFAAPSAQPRLRDGTIKVAFAISKHVNVMDIAGPWEVFADTSLRDRDGKNVAPYELYTVAAGTAPIQSAGGNRPGLTITPDYDFAHAPKPDIVVVPAQQGSPELEAWLKRIHAEHVTIMSVCTGAFKLAQAGLLDGKQATTHHWYFGNFAREFPDVKLVKQVRYVQADPVTFTAGGLTSGVDLALHMVADRFGQDVAQQTADFMEYLGTGWKSNHGISPLDMPITREEWTGSLASGDKIVLHVTTYGASPAFAVDIPAQDVRQSPVTIAQDGKDVTLEIPIAGHPARFAGHMNADGDVVTGSFTQDGKSSPLELTKQPVAHAPGG
jgi:putative intracellular protease/amidase